MIFINYFFSKNLIQSTFRLSMLGGVIVIVLVTAKEDWRANYRGLFSSNHRQILSTVSGDVFNNGSSIKVIKLKTSSGILIEVFDSPQEGARPLLHKISLPSKRDGYVQIGSSYTNLALKDMDGDQVLEVLVPTFDENLVAQLNIYKYNAMVKEFQPYLVAEE